MSCSFKSKSGVRKTALLPAVLMLLSPGTLCAQETTIKTERLSSGEIPAASWTGPWGAQEEKSRKSASPNVLYYLKKAYDENPSLRAARAELLASYEKYPQAAAGYLPTVSVDGGVTGSSLDGDGITGVNDDGATSYEIEAGVSQPVFRGGQTLAALRAAKSAVEAQRFLLRAEEQNVIRQAGVAYLNLVRDQALVSLAENNLKLISRQRDATRDRYEVGELTKTDLAQADARYAEAEAQLITAKGDYQASAAKFRQVTGATPPDRLPAIPSLEISFPENLDLALEAGFRNNPSLNASIALNAASKEDVRRIFGELLPQVSLVGSWTKTWDPSPGLYDDRTTKILGLSASVPLYQGGATRSRVREARYTENQTLMEIDETRRSVRQSIVDAWEGWQTAKAEILSRKAQAEAQSIAREGVLQESRVGTRTVLDALDADQEYLDARVALVTAQTDESTARMALAESIGWLTPEILGFESYESGYDDALQRTKNRFFSLGRELIEDRR